MNIILNKKRLFLSLIILWLLVFGLLNITGYIFDIKYISVFAAVNEVNKFELRNRLLLSAISRIGVSGPKEAAEVWADGVKERNGAMQYSVMSQQLGREYAEQLERNAPNWVTGVSSPWVEDYKIIDTKTAGENQSIIELEFSLTSSTGPEGSYRAVLTVSKENSFWRITEISADRELIPYTGFDSYTTPS